MLVRQLPAALPGPDLEGLRFTCSKVLSAVLVVAAVRLARRVRHVPTGTGERRVLGVVYGYGMAVLIFVPFSARVLQPLLGFGTVTLLGIQSASFAVLPFVFAAGILYSGFARTGELDELATWLGSQVHDEGSLRDVLAHVLGDPSVAVLFVRPESGYLVDTEGHEASLDRSPGRGAVRVLGSDGVDSGVTLTYDGALYVDPAPVEQAGRVVAVALERERSNPMARDAGARGEGLSRQFRKRVPRAWTAAAAGAR